MTTYRPPTALPPGFLLRQDVKTALARHDFGAVFRLAHTEVPLSYAQLAQACGIKPERVGLLARGRGRITSFEKITAIADALRIPGHMVGLAPRSWENTDGDDVRRREFLTASASAGLAVALTVPQLPGKRLGSRLPDQLRERTARLRRLDDVLGGGDTRRVYLGEYQATKRLLREGTYTESTGRDLLSVLAEQAQQAGWAAFDAGHHDDARGLYEDSHHAATTAGDPVLAANALAFLAYQERDPHAAVHIALQSCHTAGSDAPPSARALLHERRAWAHALAGESGQTERALEAAASALAERADDPQPDWAAWVDHTELGIMTGRCWAELGRPLRAVPVLEQALAGFDDAHARDKALYTTWLASAYMSAGEVEQAAASATRVLTLSAGVASVRPRQRLIPVLDRLAQHRSLLEVADVLELARTV
ncbi:XRE family transcriptional regulator [Nocardiopsis sp. FR4]|uniref:XRE family transcriptional regulator n=1 Tax=Nocardiopsis sp. FR4 TaxID=2605985 RepID=UPI00135BE3D4|nr:XRE family transcriptional regulator [Nocardiopsis sp. FR4]